jgi:Cu+-exporting ATPase
VNLDASQATVRWNPGTEPDIPAVILAVEAEGFGARLFEASQRHTHVSGWTLNLWVGLPITALLMAGEWVFGLSDAPWFQWLSFGLATLVQVVAGSRFYRGAWSQLKAGSSNMDTLVALGSSTAFVYSAWALLSGSGLHLYFMEAAAIITLISLGHWVESRVSLRASSALRKLLNLAPAKARRLDPSGNEIEVSVSQLHPEDHVVLRPGDGVPTDGQVIEGTSVVDESMLTGESLPVDKTLNSQLYAGTVNINGRLTMRVTAIGEQTALAHIIAAVQRAQDSRATIQRIGDRVSSVFVPIVAVIALAAGLWWGLAPESARAVSHAVAGIIPIGHLLPPHSGVAAGFIVAAAVLIVACPCAMGLATPAAIMAGSNAAAERGILIRDGIALEKAGLVTAVIFDKTGTLTSGKPTVTAVWEAQAGASRPQGGELTAGKTVTSVQFLAGALARGSTHPLSRAIAKLSADTALQFTDWQEVHGAGVQARMESRTISSAIADLPPDAQARLKSGQVPVRLGALRWLKLAGIDLSPGQSFIDEWSGQGASVVGLSIDNSLAALFALTDQIKPGASQVVQQLEGQGLKIYLLTGDNALTAASIARQAGINPARVMAEVRPEEKAAFLQKLQQAGERLAFVGDGINDAPALEQADLGIAVSRASDIAREAADIILLKSDIEAVPESLGLARATLRTIKQNLFWAFFYNAAAIPLAALGLMSPILCAAAMGLSDLVVIGNALRLRKRAG